MVVNSKADLAVILAVDLVPLSIKNTWTRDTIKTVRSNPAEANQQRRQAQSRKSIVDEWAKRKRNGSTT